MIITVMGYHGSGKSTAAKLLAKKLNYAFFSGGDLRGEIAMRHGLTIDQLNDIGLREQWTDKECDDLIVEMGLTKDKCVFDSWTAWHFIPKSFKVFLTCDPHVRAERVFAKQRPDEQKHDTVAGVQAMLEARNMNNAVRYKKWYGFELFDMKNYDLVIDTTHKTSEDIVQEILKQIKK